jgi:hypothetical protein
MMDMPKRRCEVAIRIGADDVNAVCRALHEIEFMYATEGMGRESVSGGPDAGWIVVDNETPTQTHDQYFAEVDAWIAKHKAQKVEL